MRARSSHIRLQVLSHTVAGSITTVTGSIADESSFLAPLLALLRLRHIYKYTHIYMPYEVVALARALQESREKVESK